MTEPFGIFRYSDKERLDTKEEQFIGSLCGEKLVNFNLILEIRERNPFAYMFFDMYGVKSLNAQKICLLDMLTVGMDKAELELFMLGIMSEVRAKATIGYYFDGGAAPTALRFNMTKGMVRIHTANAVRQLAHPKTALENKLIYVIASLVYENKSIYTTKNIEESIHNNAQLAGELNQILHKLQLMYSPLQITQQKKAPR